MERKDKQQAQIARQEQTALNQSPKKEEGQRKLSGRRGGTSLLLLCMLLFLGSVAFMKYVPALSKDAGTALGSWRGVMQGIASGAEAGVKAGKEEGLSAKDTTIKIGNKMTETGKLQVMLVDLKLTDLYQQGPPKAPEYAALWTMKGEGVFTVDLTQAKAAYQETENQISIEIPEPVFTPYLDDSAVEMLAEYPSSKRFLFNGSAANGYQGYLNSRTQIDRKVQEEMLTMLDRAEVSALHQVELLARSVCGSTVSIQISFAKEEE